jgi:RES domain-containing protein
MEINIPDSLAITAVNLKDLPVNWDQFENMHLMQKLGDNWIEEGKTAVLKVPSSIIHEEFNYLLNPNHADFKKIKLERVKPFLFDDRIKN